MFIDYTPTKSELHELYELYNDINNYQELTDNFPRPLTTLFIKKLRTLSYDKNISYYVSDGRLHIVPSLCFIYTELYNYSIDTFEIFTKPNRFAFLYIISISLLNLKQDKTFRYYPLSSLLLYIYLTKMPPTSSYYIFAAESFKQKINTLHTIMYGKPLIS